MKKILYILIFPSLFLFSCSGEGGNSTNEKAEKVVIKKTFEQVFKIVQSSCMAGDASKMTSLTHYGADEKYFSDQAELKQQLKLFFSDQIFIDLIAKAQPSDAKSSDLFGGSKELLLTSKTEDYEASLALYFKEFDGEYALISIQAAG